MSTHLILTQAHDRVRDLRAEADAERQANQALGERSWWRRLLGLRPASQTPRSPATESRRRAEARVARCDA